MKRPRCKHCGYAIVKDADGDYKVPKGTLSGKDSQPWYWTCWKNEDNGMVHMPEPAIVGYVRVTLSE